MCTRWFSVADNYNIRCCVTEAADIKYKTYVAIIFASSIVLLVLFPMAVVEHALILAAIWKRTFQRTWLHVLLSGLAFSDFCTGLIVQPFIALIFLLFLDKSGVFDAQKVLIADMVTYVGFMSATFFITVELILITLLSIERWLHMSRQSLMTPRRRCLIAALLLVVPDLIVAGHYLSLERLHVALTIVTVVLMLLCYLITTLAYYKVYRIIRQHQQQVQGNQNFGQPAINLAKYKRSIKSILYIFALFSVSLIPFVAGIAFVSSRESLSCLEATEVFYVSISISFLSPSLSPALYLWRMNEMRDGVKSLFCASD